MDRVQSEETFVDPAAADGASRRLVGFFSARSPSVPIEPAPRSRAWMDETKERWAYRCLPLLIANQAGWVLANPLAFSASWDGGDSAGSTRIEFLEEPAPKPSPVVSIFGYGVVTWGVPYLFRTPPGYNLLARGPANYPKDGICALEGLIETDWSVATFTMNWKLTRPNHSVTFEAGEPFCMVVPYARGELESFTPELRPVESDPGLAASAAAWARSRRGFRAQKIAKTFTSMPDAAPKAWEGHYFRGTAPDGTEAAHHQTKLILREFRAHEPHDA